MSAIQVAVIVFGVAMAFTTYRSYRRRDLLAPEAALWLAIWLGLIIVASFPDLLRKFVGPFQVARLLDLVIIVAILVLSLIVFSLNTRVRHNERKLVELVRRLALSAEDANRNGKQAEREVYEPTSNSRE